jgi:FTR1 family protein
MILTLVIAFREFLEALLIVGIFLGISKTLGLKREFEIILAACIGVGASLGLAIGTYFFSNQLRALLTEDISMSLEHYLLLISGIFIGYVVVSLHSFLNKGQQALIAKAKEQITEKAFDISLFLMIMFLVFREGFEIALFSASVSLSVPFLENLTGLFLGFAGASVIAGVAFFISSKIPLSKKLIGHVFKFTEYLIIAIGAGLTQVGITGILSSFNIYLSEILPLHLGFLPDSESFLGHVVQGILGVDQDFSGARLAVMLIYVFTLWFFFMRKKPEVAKV